MTKKSYSELLKDPRWQKKRLEIFKRDKFTCKLCGDTETTLQVHHKEYIYGNDPWDYPNSMLVTLCEHCHHELEIFKKDLDFDIQYKNIRIFKSNDWDNQSRIMFVSYPGVCSMTIYDENKRYIVGYNFSEDIDNIIKIFKRSQYV